MLHARLMPLPDPDWIDLLRQEVRKPEKSIASVAREMGMQRTQLSMLLSGTYGAKLDKVTRKFAHVAIGRYAGQTFCPHLRAGISSAACRAHASAPMSTSNPDKLKHWVACRNCTQNPVKKEDEQ